MLPYARALSFESSAAVSRTLGYTPPNYTMRLIPVEREREAEEEEEDEGLRVNPVL